MRPGRPGEDASRSSGQFLATAGLIAAAVAVGVGTAIHRRWTCDDAYISYRYALNLVEGKGLVFNASEYVEGYSNFLWTLWCAVGLLLGFSCESWTIFWGIGCFAAAILLLGLQTLRLQRELGGAAGISLPLAAILTALHGDMTVFATGGLETSLFILLAILGYVLLAEGVLSGRHRPVAAGIVMTLTAFTRPDGALFAVVGGMCLLWFSWPRWKPVAIYAVVFGLPQVVFELWRRRYYGDWLPNTYYAKSAGLAWWSQGLAYLHLYFQKYVVLYLAIPALLFCVWPSHRGPESSRKLRRLSVMAAAFGGAYALYITRLGGDFMFARLLLPATPFLLILMELALLRCPVRPMFKVLISTAIAVGLLLPGYPMNGTQVIDGVANEWSYYGDAIRNESVSATLRKYLDGVPVCVAFIGSEAHRMYKARIPTAIESEAGLTDRFIAHQSLSQRGRVGHEKNAPLEYLIRERKAHFAFHPSAIEDLGLGSKVPLMTIELGQVRGYILHWDPAIMNELRQRGAKFEDCPTFIDGLIKQINRMPDRQLADWYRMLKLYYFENLSQADHERERPFLDRLRGSAG